MANLQRIQEAEEISGKVIQELVRMKGSVGRMRSVGEGSE